MYTSSYTFLYYNNNNTTKRIICKKDEKAFQKDIREVYDEKW